MLEPFADVFSQAAKVALGWIVSRCKRDELLAALHQICLHARWRDSIVEAHDIARRYSVAIVIQHNKSLHTTALPHVSWQFGGHGVAPCVSLPLDRRAKNLSIAHLSRSHCGHMVLVPRALLLVRHFFPQCSQMYRLDGLTTRSSEPGFAGSQSHASVGHPHSLQVRIYFFPPSPVAELGSLDCIAGVLGFLGFRISPSYSLPRVFHAAIASSAYLHPCTASRSSHCITSQLQRTA